MTEASADTYIDLVVQIVSAYVYNNTVPTADLAGLISEVSCAILRLASSDTPQPDLKPQEPAVPAKKSITPDFLICLEDGQKFKSLKRHLRNQYDLTPDAYRAKWGLPADYPMVAPNYSATRSALAKRSGLGQMRRRAAK